VIPVIKFSNLFHTGIVVKDIEAAKTEYTDVFGVGWAFQGEFEMPVWMPSGPITISFCFAYTAEGPHRLELVRELPGTLWTVAGAGQVHHVGYWADDVGEASAELSRRGLPLCAKVGTDSPDALAPIVIHQASTGAYIELIDVAMRQTMFGEE
jgi:catechol 2,3-dioxygenase-like lactoylglutathione lyase family enzyme